MTALTLVPSVSSTPRLQRFILMRRGGWWYGSPALSGIPCIAVANWADVGEYFGDDADI